MAVRLGVAPTTTEPAGGPAGDEPVEAGYRSRLGFGVVRLASVSRRRRRDALLDDGHLAVPATGHP